jgi:hypothetical protein
MITCKLHGRLGNNLFQIANVIAVSNKINTGFVLPEFAHAGHRGEIFVDLSMFDYEFQRGNLRDVSFEWNDPDFHYTEIPAQDNMQLSGFYQSWKYFDSVREELLNKYFIPNKDIQSKLGNYIFGAQGMPTLGISVRRGDYLMLQDNHCVLNVEYYQNAINKLSEIADYEFIYIFSDDIEYCKTIFKDIPVYYVQDDIGTQMFLMSKMDHLILSNSTFAWWGAYLNQNNGKIIAPDPWFGPNYSDKNTKDLYLPNWIKNTHTIQFQPYTLTKNMFD